MKMYGGMEYSFTKSALSAPERSMLGAFKACKVMQDLPSPANKGIMLIKINGWILTNKEI
jgi:hypothetical protein